MLPGAIAAAEAALALKADVPERARGRSASCVVSEQTFSYFHVCSCFSITDRTMCLKMIATQLKLGRHCNTPS